ncbi:MAG: (deoxy)nucleoside triphosphate pyrophosphohydrolase [Pseudomonadota bacterium]
MPREPLLVVAAALLRRGPGAGIEVLIAQRPPGKWQAGRWEFPGGKIEPGETAEAALRRELMEELGVNALELVELRRFHHDYPDRSVEIALWLVPRFEGELLGHDGQQLRWVAPTDLIHCDLLEADLPMIEPLLAGVPAIRLEPTKRVMP